MNEDKVHKVRENKGVTATDSDINDTFSSKRHEGYSTNPSSDNLHNVKEDLRNVIELMGPGTPHLTLNSSSEADNEDSYVSTSIYSSVLQVKHVTRTDESTTKALSSDTPRDISQMSVLPVDSIYSDSDYCLAEKDDNAPGSTVAEPHYKNCPCRRYAQSLQDMAANRGFNIFTPESYSFLAKHDQTEPKTSSKAKSFNFLSFFKFRRTYKEGSREPMDLYKINILQTNDEHSPPRRLVFDLIDDIPKPDTNTVATNTSLREKCNGCRVSETSSRMPGLPGHPTAFHSYISSPKRNTEQVHKHVGTKKPKGITAESTKIDVYYFDHGNSSYFKTTDYPPALITEVIAEKTEAYTSRFWAEFFGTIHIGFAFFTSFILQLLRFLLQSLVRPLTVGLTQLTSDYFFKPCLAVIFNAIIQPPLIFFYNIATSLRDLADPLAEGVGYFLREIANVCRAIRIVDIKQDKKSTPVQIPHKKKKFKIRRNNVCA